MMLTAIQQGQVSKVLQVALKEFLVEKYNQCEYEQWQCTDHGTAYIAQDNESSDN